MRPFLVLTTSLFAAVSLSAETIVFQPKEAGKTPAGWKATQTGEGSKSEWQVTTDPTAPGKTGAVLTQKAAGKSQVFNIAVREQGTFRDGTLSVRFKSVQGRIDQGGGLVWRFQDAGNYYVCRFNPLEDNLRLYKVVDGKRKQLASKEELTVKEGAWVELKIVQKGERIEVWMDGKKYFDVADGAIAKAGLVGLWTKADAVTSFDLLEIRAAKE